MISEDHARMYKLMSGHIDEIGGMVSGLGEYGLANRLWRMSHDLASCARDRIGYIPTERPKMDTENPPENDKEHD